MKGKEELKIRKDRVLLAAKECEEAAEVLETLFPEVFEEEEEGLDITEECKFIPEKDLAVGSCYLNIRYADEDIGLVGYDGVMVFDDKYEVIRREEAREDFYVGEFKIIKKLGG